MLRPLGNLDPIVSNTTPLIALVGVGLLDLLPALHGEVWIPQAVFNEYDVGRRSRPGAPDLVQLAWLQVHSIPDNQAVPSTLDPGERETLALALAIRPRLVLIDEMRARHVAQRLGLPLAGSMTILLEAKQHGLLPAVAPIVDQMIAQGRRISPALRRIVLDQAGE